MLSQCAIEDGACSRSRTKREHSGFHDDYLLQSLDYHNNEQDCANEHPFDRTTADMSKWASNVFETNFTPIQHVEIERRHRGLDDVIFPGDVLNIKGANNMNAVVTQLGSTGGFMGHVLVVVSKPCPIWKTSAESKRYAEFWPHGANCVWRTGVVESCRNTPGLHEADVLLYIDESSKLFACGEECTEGLFSYEQYEQVQVWQPPLQLRSSKFRTDIMQAVLNDMRASRKNWSWSTALRALLRPGGLSKQATRPDVMKEVKEAWHVEPICTSIVVRFWQQYLEKLAPQISANPLDLILQFMPLRADRILPGELLITMLACGWTTWETQPKARCFKI